MRTMMMLTADDRIRYACEARWKAQMDINSYNYEIKELKNTIANKDSIISQKDTEIANNISVINQKDKELSEKDTELANRASELAEKDAEIARLMRLLSEQ